MELGLRYKFIISKLCQTTICCEGKGMTVKFTSQNVIFYIRGRWTYFSLLHPRHEYHMSLSQARRIGWR